MTRSPVDYTRKRLHSKLLNGRRIETCPKCGRKGERAIYNNGEQDYAHKGYIEMGFVTITDHCYISKPAAANEPARLGSSAPQLEHGSDVHSGTPGSGS